MTYPKPEMGDDPPATSNDLHGMSRDPQRTSDRPRATSEVSVRNTPTTNRGGDLLVGTPLYGGTFTVTEPAAPRSAPSEPTPSLHPAPGAPTTYNLQPTTLPFVLPGEHILPPTPTQLFPTILSPSLDRVPPPCPHFGPCGGCHYQHATYPAQLALKQQILTDLLTPAAEPAPLPALQTHAADPWHYRNRIRLRIEPTSLTQPGSIAAQPTSATFHIGYNRRASNHLLPIHTCPIAAPILLRSALALTALAETDPNGARWLAATAELELFTLPDETAVELTLHLRDLPSTPTRAGRLDPLPATQLPAAFTALCNDLRNRVPELAGATAQPLRPTHANTPTRPSKAALQLAPIPWGKPGLLYPVPLAPTATAPPTKTAPLTKTTTASPAETRLWVSRNSFFQTNRHLVGDLVATALRAAIPHPAAKLPLAWDLFAGVGLFARALAPFATRITAVESAPTAVQDLRAARLANIDIVATPVLDFLRRAMTGRDRPSLVLLDPPRAGLGLEAAGLLARLRPDRIVYVSCDPTSLARDLRPMLSSGYQLAELHLVDMFPQTFHLETIAVLTRSDLNQTDPAHTDLIRSDPAR